MGQGVEAMASFGATHAAPLGEDEGRPPTASPKHHKKLPMNGLTEGVGSGNRAPKLETLSGDGENSSRTSSLGQEGASRGATRGSRRKSEAEGVLGSMDTPQRLRLERSAKGRGDSSMRPTVEKTNEDEGVVGNSMFKQVKFENGAAVAQSGASHDKISWDAIIEVVNLSAYISQSVINWLFGTKKISYTQEPVKSPSL